MMQPWNFPLDYCTGIPVGSHPGAFGAKRKHDTHTGVDLYTDQGRPVYAVESGLVVAHGFFTGPQDGSPWWNNTSYVMIEGVSGVVCYGEVESWVVVGEAVRAGRHIADVVRVLKEGKERPEIPGHRPSMLHIELYKHGVRKPATLLTDDLIDPTARLIESVDWCSLGVGQLTAELNSGAP